ncbi:VOC family protein [Ekhidna sp.]|jgi:biphenyl-2,3-diol 1,2-dioxygenase|uniref:VOC family protein n=1 Tax=Ekhidna sp. TaxID=2608089 RepID=UPI0032EF78D6
MQKKLAKLGHVALVTPNLEKSHWFFHDVVGLNEQKREGNKIYYRGWADFEHHTLILIEGKEAVLDHIAWKTCEPDDVDYFYGKVESAGLSPAWVPEGEEAGLGKAFRFRLPTGQTYEIYYEMEKPLAPEGKRSRLKNQVFKSFDHGISPRCIDHVNFNVGNPSECMKLHEELFGFKVREYIQLDNGFEMAYWTSVTSLVHDLAIMFDEAGRQNRLHHTAFYLDNFQDVARAADIFRENGVELSLAPGRHGISQAGFIYAIDPGSGHRLELFSGGYHIYDPDWKPVQWKEKELAEGIIWWGPELSPTFLAESIGPEE